MELINIFTGVSIFIGITIIIYLYFFIKESLEIKKSNLSYNQKKIHQRHLESNIINFGAITLTGLLIIWSVYYGIISLQTQISLANSNQEILKQTSSSNWANIEINFGRPWEEKIIIDANELAKPSRKIEERFRIGFVIINSGKVDTKINLDTNSDKLIHVMILNHEMLINHQSGNKSIIYLKQSGCAIGAEEDCDISKLPKKEYDLKLKFYCEFCSSNERFFEINLPLCIYHNIEDENYCHRYLKR